MKGNTSDEESQFLVGWWEQNSHQQKVGDIQAEQHTRLEDRGLLPFTEKAQSLKHNGTQEAQSRQHDDGEVLVLDQMLIDCGGGGAAEHLLRLIASSQVSESYHSVWVRFQVCVCNTNYTPKLRMLLHPK
jgi:hypothetical protein